MSRTAGSGSARDAPFAAAAAAAAAGFDGLDGTTSGLIASTRGCTLPSALVRSTVITTMSPGAVARAQAAKVRLESMAVPSHVTSTSPGTSPASSAAPSGMTDFATTVILPSTATSTGSIPKLTRGAAGARSAAGPGTLATGAADDSFAAGARLSAAAVDAFAAGAVLSGVGAGVRAFDAGAGAGALGAEACALEAGAGAGTGTFALAAGACPSAASAGRVRAGDGRPRVADGLPGFLAPCAGTSAEAFRRPLGCGVSSREKMHSTTVAPHTRT